ETTGHEWDGIRELNNPLPRWWLWTFYACIIWAIGYMIAYPAIPLFTTNTPGLLGYSSRADVAAKIEAAKEGQVAFLDRIAQSEVSDIVADDELARFARAGGQAAFKVNCSQCHGSGAQGFAGFPNLNDDEWIWGGSVEDIYLTIAHGVRYEDDPDTRFNEMPAFGTFGILGREEIQSVASYTAFLGGLEGGRNTEEGALLFEENCAACHGVGGAGEPALGAPPLNNAISLFAGDFESIVSQVDAPQHGEMPGWTQKLGDTVVKQLAVYVHSLGGGE
ncbi:MAG TPA: cytochrome-c oxidase, cbb3-type subunit III, partial [Devosia sp.]|nr:cytochrome-c oxidase, cbb3-type subunit III [Devosia sp.]